MSDIKLEKDVMKNILILNNQTPRENNIYWITIEEMRDRLVHCGVDKALTTNMIGEALKKVNRGESFLTRRHEGKTPHYRPAIYSNEAGLPMINELFLKDQNVFLSHHNEITSNQQNKQRICWRW